MEHLEDVQKASGENYDEHEFVDCFDNEQNYDGHKHFELPAIKSSNAVDKPINILGKSDI